MQHIPGEHNVRGDTRSRWAQAQAILMRALAVDTPSSSDDTLPFKYVVRVAHQRALARDGIRGSDSHSPETLVGTAVVDSKGMFRVSI